MSYEIKRSRFLALPIMALIVLSTMFAVVVPDSSDAAGFDDYGTAANVNIAPGYSWTYTPSYPSDISSYVTTTIQTQGTSYGTSGTWVSITSSGLTTVTIPTTAAAGTVYHLVLKATMSQPVSQTAYQHITFTVTAGLSVSGTIDNIVKGTQVALMYFQYAGLINREDCRRRLLKMCNDGQCTDKDGRMKSDIRCAITYLDMKEYIEKINRAEPRTLSH
ncbi:MAG: hypothetical protein VB016_04390 [Methanomassiliicoccaceae archaeon]|nr:hypothetical protein [Methanomassiliicoccaceae archaeon]